MSQTETTKCTCGRPTAGAPLCEKCTRTLEYALVNVMVYLADLETVASRQARYGDGTASKGSVGREQPLPVDMRFVSAKRGGAALAAGARLRTDVTRTLRAAAIRLMRGQQPIPGPVCHGLCLHVSCAHIRKAAHPVLGDVPSVVRYLARQRVQSVPWAPRLLTELLDLEHRLVRMVDRPAERWYAGKCTMRLTGGLAEEYGPTCPVDLYARDVKGQLDCPLCGAVHDIATRRDILLDAAKDQWVTATQAASALIAWTDYDGTESKLVDRVRKWRDRGKLEVQDVTSLKGKDRHLYRLGDVQDLLVGDAQNAQSRRIGVA